MAQANTAHRFEPERAEEIRRVVREAFPDDEKLRLADVVFERAPQKPDGEAGVIVQTVRKAGRGGPGLAGKYLDLPFVEALIDGGELAAELGAFREELLDELAVAEEGPEPDPTQRATQILEEHRDRGTRERNRLGSLMVRDGHAIARRREARAAAEGESPMTDRGFLRLCGWVRYWDVGAADEARRRLEAGESLWLISDHGDRYTLPDTGMEHTIREALGMQMMRDARDVGGIRAYKELIDRHRIP